MPFQESLYQLRSNTNQPYVFEETPIFIGTASHLYTETSDSGFSSIIVPDLGNAYGFNFEQTEVDVKYWYNVGNYVVNSIDLSRKILFVSDSMVYDDIQIGSQQYTCFIINTNTNQVVFTSFLQDAVFTFDYDNNKYLQAAFNYQC